jgi:hypothetical protein
MSSVNDLMLYLGKSLGVTLPTLPLGQFLSGLSNLWKATVKNWTDGQSPPEIVEVDLPEPIAMPIAGGNLQMTQAHISITQTPPPKKVTKSAAPKSNSKTI